MKVIWSELAVQRVSEIAEYIADDNVSAADKWVGRIFKRAEDLSLFENSGRRVPESNDKKIRELVFGNYRIIYKIQSTVVYVLTVRHFKQMLPLEEINPTR